MPIEWELVPQRIQQQRFRTEILGPPLEANELWALAMVLMEVLPM
jgi:hypothetical protein